MGVVECLNHKLVEPFNVLYEKEGKGTAHCAVDVIHVHVGAHPMLKVVSVCECRRNLL